MANNNEAWRSRLRAILRAEHPKLDTEAMLDSELETLAMRTFDKDKFLAVMRSVRGD